MECLLFKPKSPLVMAAALASTLWMPTISAKAEGLAGPYLAAIQASYRNDYVSAAQYFTSAVASDPSNSYLLQNAVMNNLLAGSFDTAVPLARRLSELEADRQIAGLVLVADAIGEDDFAAASALLDNETFRFNPLLIGLLRGWVAVGLGDMTSAQAQFDALDETSGFGALGQYHKALVLALAGNFDAAETIFAGDEEPLRISRASILAHAQVLLQLDRRDEAVAMLEEFGMPAQSEIGQVIARIQAGDAIDFDAVTSPRDGAAEVFLTLATALSREEADVFALLYSRLAQEVRPAQVEAHLLSADLLDAHGQYALAIQDYARVPESSAQFRDAEIGRAEALTSMGDVGAAIIALERLAQDYPEDGFIHVSLADTLRSEERYEDAIESYTRAISLDGEGSEAAWRNYYVRGISYERLGRWDEAEADFRKSLELRPGQPLVLNYLGYSLVEKNLKIDEARLMIEEAVAADPDNGYITDSLGWVLYKIGEYEEAVPHMERAVELLPSDPVINDHLGDVLWKVDRKNEAVFQWKRALSFVEPDSEVDPDRIRRKLDVGLDVVLEEEAAAGAE